MGFFKTVTEKLFGVKYDAIVTTHYKYDLGYSFSFASTQTELVIRAPYPGLTPEDEARIVRGIRDNALKDAYDSAAGLDADIEVTVNIKKA